MRLLPIRLSVFLACLAALPAFALVPVVDANLSQPTGIAPLYFGPNAFPVPDLLRGEVDDQLSASLYADGYWGFDQSRTADLGFRLSVPLFTRWASLQVWMPLQEWYSVPQDQAQDRVGHGAGDVYVTTHIQLLSRDFRSLRSLQGAEWIPSVSLRVALKSASGGQYALRRHYDTPGYWFDAALDQPLLPSSCPVSLVVTASAGFLCWQTDNGRQNDAVQYGVGLALEHTYLSASAQLVGYSGWEHYGDRPMVLRAQLSGHVSGFSPFVQYQYGLRDYPYHQLRIGLTYQFDVLSQHRRSVADASAVAR